MDFEIHKTHSKSDLIKVIETFELFDNNFKYKDLNKQTLQLFLIDAINQIDEIDLDNDLYIDDVEELKEYLINPNLTKIPIKDKNKILKIAKDINFYFKTNKLNFESIEDMIEKAESISYYGDCPSVRRAIKQINNIYNKKIEVNITPKVLYDLLEKEEEKKEYEPKMKVIKKEFVISFN